MYGVVHQQKRVNSGDLSNIHQPMPGHYASAL